MSKANDKMNLAKCQGEFESGVLLWSFINSGARAFCVSVSTILNRPSGARAEDQFEAGKFIGSALLLHPFMAIFPSARTVPVIMPFVL
jgi:hypothetical protein